MATQVQEKKNEKIHGNFGLISAEEGAVAQLLKENNLERVNRESAPVHPRKSLYTGFFKRVLDLIVAVPVFLLLLPLNLLFAVLTLFDVGCPIIFKQTRCGRNGKTFTMIKFRNMNNKKDENGNLLPASQRVTKFGKIMRKFSLDELLNLWSVIKGDMSIIGPRPLPVFYIDRMSERHKMRHAVRPGLECPRMVEETDPNISAYHYQFENDVWYAENISFKTDVMMIFRLIKMVCSMGKRTRNAQAASYFVGYDESGRATSLKKYLETHNIENEKTEKTND